MLAGDGMSQVTKTLLDLTQRKNFYAGDLLVSVEILRNVTDTFKRASYIPASDGVQVREKKPEKGKSSINVISTCSPPAPRHQLTLLGGPPPAPQTPTHSPWRLPTSTPDTNSLSLEAAGLEGRNVPGFIETSLPCIMWTLSVNSIPLTMLYLGIGAINCSHQSSRKEQMSICMKVL
jgi:hypothetical protein